MQAVRQAATAGGNRKRKASDKRLDEDEVHRDYSSTILTADIGAAHTGTN